MCGHNGIKHSLTRLHLGTKTSSNITRAHHLSLAANVMTIELLCLTFKATINGLVFVLQGFLLHLLCGLI